VEPPPGGRSTFAELRPEVYPVIALPEPLAGPGGAMFPYDVAIMMAKTQISLSPEELRKAKLRAASRGISLAEYVRRLVAEDLHGTRRITDPTALFDLGDSGGSVVAQEKDVYVGQAISARRSTHRRRG
jgi:hypothetical protein